MTDTATAVALARVKMGVNTMTMEPIYYVEARVNASRPWAMLTDGERWLYHRSKVAAEREARSMQRRLSAKLASVES